MNRALAAAALVAAVAATPAGCSLLAPATPPEATPGTTPPPRGGTLRIGLTVVEAPPGERVGYSDPHRMPYFSEAFPLARCCLFRTLMSYPGLEVELGGSSVLPDLAVSAPAISADGLTWTFRIREGIRYGPPFEDREVVAADFVRAFERVGRLPHLLDVDRAFAAAETAGIFRIIEGFDAYADQASPTISGIETPDRLTVVFRLTRPSGDFDRRVALPATSPLPEGAADGHDHDYAGFSVSTGPYRHEPAAPGAPHWADRPSGQITLVRNPSWSAATDPIRGAWVDRIEIRGVPVPGEGRRLVDTGELDFLFDHLESPEEQADVEARDGSRRRLRSAFLNVTSWIPMNLAVRPFDDVAVRRAVAFAVDRRAFIEGMRPLFGEQLLPARHGLPDGATNNLLLAYDPFRADDGPDPGAARQEMSRSRYDSDADGRCDSPACRGILTVARSDLSRAAIEGIVDDLADIGLELDVEIVPGSRFDFYERLLPENKVGLALYAGSTNFDVDAGQQVPPWDGRNAGELLHVQTTLIGATREQLAGWGYGITDVPSVDAKIDECSPLLGQARYACWAEFDQVLTEGVVPAVFLSQGEATFLVSDRIVRFHIDQAAGQPALDQIAIAGG